MSRHDAAIDALVRDVLASADERRLAAFEGARLEGVVGDYVTKLRHSPSRLVDRDIDALRAAGLDEDTILELTLAAAVGAALKELRAPRHP